ncbi:cupin domain-containing protein [Altererythrobacter marinus]|uniref:Cupin domain-containing protein n=1 Tax=Pelagerythrobacter marinus TaxID=538382 RepID=A0ABW9UXF5_9SPHN|nr:cupin domain-containing protein [Pelagerythrobacter marinus]MXO67372.1 cupin domain-containing protein [Pelagerythrobacter marinus]
MYRDIQRRSPAFTPAAEAAIEQVDPGIRRQILGHGPDLMVCRVWFEQGAIGQVHSHPHSQSSYVESGRFRVTIDGEERELEAGDGFYVAPFLDHGAVCLEAGCLLDTFNPARADFLGEEG